MQYVCSFALFWIFLLFLFFKGLCFLFLSDEPASVHLFLCLIGQCFPLRGLEMEMEREREREMCSLEKQDCYFQLKVIPLSLSHSLQTALRRSHSLQSTSKRSPIKTYKPVALQFHYRFLTATSERQENSNRAGEIFINTLKTSLLIMT